MAYYYAQLNDGGVCAATSILAGEIDEWNMIPISAEEYADGRLMGAKYDDGDWTDTDGEGAEIDELA
jgi:hypothetical protein